MNRKYIFSAIFLCFFINSFIFAQEQDEEEAKPPSEVEFNPYAPYLQPQDIDPALFFSPVRRDEGEYVVGPEDLLEVQVYQVPELNTTARIGGDGAITLPVVGPIIVSGLTVNAVSEKIAKTLEDKYIQDPQVNVSVKEFKSQKISIIGMVKSPGSYSLSGPRTIIQLIAEAGGLMPEAGDSILIFRQARDGRSARLAIPKEELFVKGSTAWNIPLRSGDVVNIPAEESITVSILGALATPGIYPLSTSDGATLLKAIAKAGGLKQASKGNVTIKRQRNGKEVIMEVKLGDILSGKIPDFELQNGDVIIIKERFF
jgi:polysaccharide export outer membrane protein